MGDFSPLTSRLQGKVSCLFTACWPIQGDAIRLWSLGLHEGYSLDACWHFMKGRKIISICFWWSSAQDPRWRFSDVLKSIKQRNLISEEIAWMREWNTETFMEIQLQLKFKSKAKLWQKQRRQDSSREWYYSTVILSHLPPLCFTNSLFYCALSSQA